MDTFEKQFEDLDVQAQVMEGAMQSSSAATMPEGQVGFRRQEDFCDKGKEDCYLLLSKSSASPPSGGLTHERDCGRAWPGAADAERRCGQGAHWLDIGWRQGRGEEQWDADCVWVCSSC